MFLSLRKIVGVSVMPAASLLFLAANLAAQNPEAEKIYQYVKENILQIGDAKCVSEMSR